jgi:hypothetical protein
MDEEPHISLRTRAVCIGMLVIGVVVAVVSFFLRNAQVSALGMLLALVGALGAASTLRGVTHTLQKTRLQRSLTLDLHIRTESTSLLRPAAGAAAIRAPSQDLSRREARRQRHRTRLRQAASGG